MDTPLLVGVAGFVVISLVLFGVFIAGRRAGPGARPAASVLAGSDEPGLDRTLIVIFLVLIAGVIALFGLITWGVIKATG